MKASVGDRIVVASRRVDGHVRDGEVVELRHPDGTPPFVVRWSDTGQTSVFYPGVETRVVSTSSDVDEDQPRSSVTAKTWTIQVSIIEDGDSTTVDAELLAGPVAGMHAEGMAHRNPADLGVSKIGEEVALARALRHLADQVLQAAAEDIGSIEGRRPDLHT